MSNSTAPSLSQRFLPITPGIALDTTELQFTFMRSGGPGGQNVNKLSSAVRLRWNVQASNLPQHIKQRLIHLAGRRLCSAGILTIEAREYRHQWRNRQAALQRLLALLRQAAQPTRLRHPTRPTPASKHRRLQEKRRRSAIKRARQTATKADLSE